MFSWFKKYFYPHEGNDHHPHLLRTEIASFLLSLIFFGEVVFLFSILVILPKTNFFANILPDVLVDSTNVERQRLNENTLSLNPLLQQAAQAKANDMATKSYFAHTSPEGLTPWHWLKQVEYPYVSAGENLAINFVDSQDVVIAWMNSPGHRANILNQSYTEIGVATAIGVYKGQEATFVVQFFGQPITKTSLAPPIDQPAPLQSEPAPTTSLTPPPLESNNSAEEVFLDKDISQVESETITTLPLAVSTIEPAVTYSSFKDRLLSNPKSFTTNILLMIVLGFMLVTIFTILIHNGTLKTRAILNGVICMAIIIAIVYFNQYLASLNTGVL